MARASSGEQVWDGADWTITGRRSLNSRRFIFRVKDRAAYRRDEFALYFRTHGLMEYVPETQGHLCGRRPCAGRRA